MSRIVVDPENLSKVARVLVEAGDDYARRASLLRGRPLPSMPPATASNVMSGLAEVTKRLDDTSTRLEMEAFLLRMRAAMVSGDTGALAAAGLAMFGSVLSGADSLEG